MPQCIPPHQHNLQKEKGKKEKKQSFNFLKEINKYFINSLI
jgi:hypothetical protein